MHDNARIHHSKIVKEMSLNNNISIIYNPPYTHEFNPIELSFSKVKTIFRSFANHTDMKSDIEDCLSSITKEDSLNFLNMPKK